MTTRLSSADHRHVQKLCSEFQVADEKTKQVYIRDQLDEVFSPFYVKWRLTPKEVGIHPGNRDGDRMTPSGVWVRGERIINSGFSVIAIGRRWAFEDNPKTKHIEQHTLEVTSGDNRFATFVKGEVKVGPANWTHSNQFVCMVVDETVCDYRGLPCTDGRIDSGHIRKDPRNKRLDDYIKNGMIFDVFPSWVEEAYPTIPIIFQSACNQEQQVQEGEGWLQLLRKVSTRASEMCKAGRPATNDEIAKAVLRSQPRYANDVPDIVDYNQKWGGGLEGFYINDISRYLTARNIPPFVRVSGRQFQALTNLQFGVKTMPAMAVNAILKRMASSSCEVDGVSSIYRLSEIASFSNKKERRADFLHADEIMRNCHKILFDNDVEPLKATMSEGWLQMTLVDHILEKPNLDGDRFSSMSDVVQKFMRSVFGEAAEKMPMGGPSSSGDIVKYDVVGNAIDAQRLVLARLGFTTGENVTKTKSSATKLEVWTISSIKPDGNTTLELLSATGHPTGHKIDVEIDALASEYKLWNRKFEDLAGYPSIEGKNSDTLEQMIGENKMVECCFTLAKTVKLPAHIRVQLQPSKGLFCSADAAVSTIRIMPTPFRASAIVNEPTSTRAHVGTISTTDGKVTKFELKSPVTVYNKFCNGFFYIMSTDDENAANMKVEHEQVNFVWPAVGKLRIAGREHVASIPYFVNHKPVKKDEELLYYKAKDEKREKQQKELSLSFASAPKRQKK